MHIKGWRFAVAFLVGILGITTGIAPIHLVMAQSGDELELINQINALRASYGQEPYSVDPDLMALAREHSAYQASIHKSTHQHSDGRVPAQIGVVENVAGGDLGYLTPQAAIYNIWVMDAGHLKTLVGFASGSMGVGIADDGATAYYTLEVRPGTALAETPDPQSNSSTASGGTRTPYIPIPVIPLATMTALPDGTIIHVVGYGQTLWSIAMAYRVHVDQIRAWNNIPPDSTVIYAGQKLLVRPASLVTPFLATSTSTPAPAASIAITLTHTPTTYTPSEVMETQATTSPTSPVEQAAESLPPDPTSSTANLIPALIGGVSILLGSVLLVLLLLRWKTA